MSATSLRRRTRPQLKGDEREAALRAVAERLLADDRFEAASVADLAGAAGVSRPTFYFYFASKDALLASVIDATYADIAARLEAALRGGEPPVARLAAALRAVADAWWEHRAVMAAALELAHRVPELGQRMRATMDGADVLSAEILMTHGTVPEREDPVAALALVRTLGLLNEQIFGLETQVARRRGDLAPVELRLLHIWTRTMGLFSL